MTTITDPEDIGLRERKKQHTRRAIHEAAFRLIDEQGLEATTIDQICSAAEVSSRTFFNYFPSKAAALLELPETAIGPEAVERFRAAKGSLLLALCDAIGSSADIAPSHERMKSLIKNHPELISTVSQMMLELRGQYVALASERAHSPEESELAVGVVMMALGRVIHEGGTGDESLAQRLRETVEKFGKVFAAQLD